MSCAPGKEHLRISVKKDGLVSSYLHDHVSVGDELQLGVPCGDFTLCPGQTIESGRDVVFVGAGIGITPLVGMMEACLDACMDGTKITFVQCCRGSHEHPMRGEMEQAKERGVRLVACWKSAQHQKKFR